MAFRIQEDGAYIYTLESENIGFCNQEPYVWELTDRSQQGLSLIHISSGIPNLPAGISSVNAARSSSEKHAFICVSMQPHAMAFTWILLGASSLARPLVKDVYKRQILYCLTPLPVFIQSLDIT